jgi:hypothetical protein
MLTPVVSLPVPAVVGIGDERLQGARHRQPFADRRVDVIEKIPRADTSCRDSRPWRYR